MRRRDGQAEDDEDGQGGEACRRHDVLEPDPGPDPGRVHGRQDEDRSDRDQVAGMDDERTPEESGAEDRAGGGEGRDEGAAIFGEAHGQRRDAAAADDPEERPAEDERGRVPESVSEIDIRPARLGIERAELRVSQRAHYRQRSARDPHEPDESGRGKMRGDDSGGQEDPRAENRPDDQKGRVGESDPALEGAAA